jgi:hypothetical protein
MWILRLFTTFSDIFDQYRLYNNIRPVFLDKVTRILLSTSLSYILHAHAQISLKKGGKFKVPAFTQLPQVVESITPRRLKECLLSNRRRSSSSLVPLLLFPEQTLTEKREREREELLLPNANTFFTNVGESAANNILLLCLAARTNNRERGGT